MRFVTMLVLAAMTTAANASLMVNPSYVDISTRAGGGGLSRTVIVRNLGPNDAHVSVYDTCGSEFRIYHNCFGLLRENFTCSIQIQFTPRDRGTRSCNVQINAGAAGSRFVSVRGTGY